MIRATSRFPHPETADATGLVAVSDAITPELLLDAYTHGIFPWSEAPVLWYSPDPRAVFVRDHVRLPRRLGKILRHNGFRVTFDQAFVEVMEACAAAHSEDGTWITPGFVRAYGELFRTGYAHSVEVWQGEALAGGLYGVQIRGLFAGESMFHRVPNASKLAFAFLMEKLRRAGTVLIDAQVINPFTLQLGACLVPRAAYLRLLEQALTVITSTDGRRWPADPGFDVSDFGG